MVVSSGLVGTIDGAAEPRILATCTVHMSCHNDGAIRDGVALGENLKERRERSEAALSAIF